MVKKNNGSYYNYGILAPPIYRVERSLKSCVRNLYLNMQKVIEGINLVREFSSCPSTRPVLQRKSEFDFLPTQNARLPYVHEQIKIHFVIACSNYLGRYRSKINFSLVSKFYRIGSFSKIDNWFKCLRH